MKKKIFYLLVLIFYMSFFSSARQSDSICNENSPCPLDPPDRPGKLKCVKQPQPVREETGFDFSPFSLFLFSR